MGLFAPDLRDHELVKANIPASLCTVALLFCTFQVQRARNSYFPPGSHYKVDIVVHAPDGTEIKPIQPAPR